LFLHAYWRIVSKLLALKALYMGLPRRYRLTSRPVFNRVLKTTRLGQCPFGLVLGLPKLPQHLHYQTQFGIIISKKVHKRSHERNRLRRQLRAILLTVSQQLPAMANARCWVVVLKPAALGQSYQTLLTHFENTLRQASQKLPTPL
jgi:ribonuclease P protein component